MSVADTASLRSAHAASPRRQRAALLLLLGSMTAFGALSIDMYLPGLPELARDLQAGHGAAQLTIAAFLLGMAFGQLLYGPLADRLGRRPPLVAGIVLFAAASLGCAFAPSIEALIGLRALQAIGACSGMVISRAVVRDLYEPRESVNVYAMLMLVMGLAPIFAPLIGGYVIVAAGWRAIFFLIAAFGLAVGLGALLRLPETRPSEVAAHSRGEGAFTAYGRILADRRIMGYAIAGSLSAASLFAYISASSSLLIEIYGVPVHLFGWIFGINALGLIGSGQLNRRLTRRWSSEAILIAGSTAACAFAVVMAAAAFTGFGGPWGVLVPLWFVLATYGVAQPNVTALIMQHGGLRAGAASGVFGFLQAMCGAAAAAVTGLLYDGTARPLAGVVLATLLCATVVLRLIPKSDAAS